MVRVLMLWPYISIVSLVYPLPEGEFHVFRTLKGGRGNSAIVYVPRLFPLTTVLLPWK